MRTSVKTSINLLTLSHAWNKSDVFDLYKKKGHFALFMLEAMSRSDLPSFTYRGRKHPLQKSQSWYAAFDKDLKRYFSENKTVILKAAKRTACKEAKRFPKQLSRLLETFGKYKPTCTSVTLTPNIFGVPGEGYGPLIGKTAYAVFTPDTKKDQTWLMIHEVCHSLLLPVFQSADVKRSIKKTMPLMEKWSTKKFRRYYPKWEWLIEEYFIHTIEQYVSGSSISEKMSWGMSRLPWFIDSWSAFQSRRKIDSDLSVEKWVRETLSSMEKSVHK